MLRSVVRRPSPATIIALLVLVVIAAPLADAAQKAVSSPKAQSAADKKKKKSDVVEHAKFADNAGKIRGYSVGFAALPNRVVLTDGKGKLPAAVIPAEAQGPKGDQGPPGIQGPKGAGFGQVRLVPTPNVSSATSDVATAEADCDAGEKVTGGGYEVVYPVRAAATDRSGAVEIRINKPVVPDVGAGISGWEVQAVRLPPEVAFVSDGAGGVKAQPPTSPDKLVVIKAWAVCAK